MTVPQIGSGIDPPFVEPPAPWTTAWPALPALLLALVGSWGLRRTPRIDRRLVVVLGVALAVRTLWLPVEQHQYDGHEAEYLDIYLGRRDLTRGGPLLYPVMQWLYWLLGRLPTHEAVPVVVSLGASLLAIAALVGLVGRLARPEAGLAAGLALALWGNHAFWSSSAYNVILPHALGLVALWALAVWCSGDSPLAAGALAAGAGALAVLLRVESWLLAPVGLLLVLAHRPAGATRALPPILFGAVVAACGTWLVLFPGTTPGAGQRDLSFAINHDLYAYFAPFDQLWAAGVAAVGLGLGLFRFPRLFVPLVVLIGGSHLLFASFDDYGFRHLLNAEAALAAGLGVLVVHRWARWLAPVALVALVGHTQDVADRYYMPEHDLVEAAEAEGLPERSLHELDGCTLISEDGRVVPEDRQISHFNLYDPAEERALRERTGCVSWLRSLQDERWSSRAVRDRALRLEHLFVITDSAVVVDDEAQVMGVLATVGDRRPGRGP